MQCCVNTYAMHAVAECTPIFYYRPAWPPFVTTAAICCVHDTVTPQHAVTLVVDAIRQLIGAEGKRLNSMGIIGKRIGFPLHAGDLTIVAGGLPIIDVEEDG